MLLNKNVEKILDSYFKNNPSPQNALDIFKNEWSSKLPGEYAKYQAGNIALFEDLRIDWAISEFGGIENKTILELGPLEGGNTYMLEKHGAKSVLAIEANSRAFLKCLIVKELLDLKKSRFLCGNFVEFLKTNDEKFDCCFATGVLYHLENPVELIYLLSKTSDNIFMWTHYYDKKIAATNPNLSIQTYTPKNTEYKEFRHTLYRHEYKTALEWSGFCGGLNQFSNFMTRDDILQCLKKFGYNKIKINFEQPDHPNGAAFAILAKKN